MSDTANDRYEPDRRADRGRGPMVRHNDHFVMAEPEPFHEGWIGRLLSRIMRAARRGA